MPASSSSPSPPANNNDNSKIMPPPPDLTLVVAATRDMGIGCAGGLPWTGLRREMAYFARVTKRLPAGAPPSARNAVIMGRRTWESVPARFRPLAGRLNVVLSRSFAAPSSSSSSVPAPGAGSAPIPSSSGDEHALKEGEDGVVRAASLEQALAYLQSLPQSQPDGNSPQEDSPGAPPALGRVFVIGGAEVYAAALALTLTLPQAKKSPARRVLLTRVLSDFECDTFFPLRLGGEDSSGSGDGGENSESTSSWVRTSKAAHDAWAGEEVPGGVQSENGTEYEFQMWERVD